MEEIKPGCLIYFDSANPYDEHSMATMEATHYHELKRKADMAERLKAKLSEYRIAASRMLDKWAEAEQFPAVRNELWKKLHSLEDSALDLIEEYEGGV